MKLTFKMGKFETVLVPVVTDAPEEYDGFGTFTLRNYPYPSWSSNEVNDARLVMIREENLTWQTMRYSSGGYAYDKIPDDHNPALTEDYLIMLLLAKLSGKEVE